MLKFNAWGWIIAHEDKGLEGSKTMRFDDKSSALAWVKEEDRKSTRLNSSHT